jgi:DNA-binding IclR family transcriptional regulator
MTNVEMEAKSRYTVPALAHGLAILALFTRERPVWTPPEITQELSLARATVFRLLQTLEATGYVMRDSGGRSFRLGASVLSRGFAYLSSLDLVEVAQPILKRLRDETGLSSHLVVRDGKEIVYIARFAAHSTLSSSVTVGTRFPVHATVLGRMLICEFSDAQLAELYPEQELPKFSEYTPGTRKELAALLAEDRVRGYATSQSFFERGVSSIAAPVRDKLGNIIASLNVSAVDTRVTLEDMNGFLKDEVLKAAAEITEWIIAEGPQWRDGIRP